jgi:hypothetical protein
LRGRADGVDFEDPAAVKRWIDDFNRGSIEDRDDVLGPLPPRAERADSPPGSRPIAGARSA